MNTTTLTGSEKQIAWAEKIRAAKLADRARVAADCAKDYFAAPGVAVALDAVCAAWLQENVFSQTSAAWWIERRNVNFEQEAALACREQVRALRKKLKEGS